jgi:hypothetical protein
MCPAASLGRRSSARGIASRIRALTSRVEASPFFRIVISTERRPSTWTRLVCGALPSRTLATSRM